MKPTRITVHYAATKPNWFSGRTLLEKIAEIKRWHLARGFKREGYHWFIDVDGEEAQGRPFNMQGAHVYRHNKNNIGICLIGGYYGKADGQFRDNFTEAQEKALINRIKVLQKQFGIPDSQVFGHNNFAATACPGCDIPTWWSTAKNTRTQGKAKSLAEILTSIFAIFRRK